MNATSLTTPQLNAEAAAGAQESLSRREFIEAMATAPTAVTVVLHEGPDGIIGQTVSAFASVCADPPTLLVCVNSHSPLHARLSEGSRFTVSLLEQNQSAIADRFAGKSVDGHAPYDIDATDWDIWPSGLRTVAGAAAGFECEVIQKSTCGTHGVFIAQVVDTHHDSGDARGLVYCARGYRRMAAN